MVDPLRLNSLEEPELCGVDGSLIAALECELGSKWAVVVPHAVAVELAAARSAVVVLHVAAVVLAAARVPVAQAAATVPAAQAVAEAKIAAAVHVAAQVHVAAAKVRAVASAAVDSYDPAGAHRSTHEHHYLRIFPFVPAHNPIQRQNLEDEPQD